MRFYTFGKKDAPVILLLPGTCCHWRANFGGVIPLLEPDFCVVCASYDGFDETEPEAVFPDMLTETAKIESYLQKNFGGQICAAYGCSLGGSFVGLLAQRQNVHIRHAILGSSDMDQGGGPAARLQGRLMAGMVTGLLHKGRLPGWMQRYVENRPAAQREYMRKFAELFCNGGQMKFVKKQSVYNQYYSDLVTPVAEGLAVPDTAIHCFYAVKMGAEYEKRYRRHFRSPDVRRHDLEHEELLLRFPQEWAAEVRRCCEVQPETPADTLKPGKNQSRTPDALF